MGLLLNLADEGEHRLIGLDANLPALRRDQGPGAVPVVLYHAEHRDGQPQGLQHLHRHFGVVLAAVDEEHVGQLPELLVPVQVAPEAAGEHLLHGGVVVGGVHVPELEAAVVPL